MKKFTSIFLSIIMAVVILLCCGCNNNVLEESYNIPSKDFKGMNFECFSDGNTANNVRNQMVYFDFPEFVKEDLESKGNKINSISVIEANGNIFHETQTVANILVDIDAKSGDIPSGEYNISAYFVYNTENEADVKMYLMNYCFVSSSKIDTSLFDESYEIIKDKKIP